jgi:hypothetical protein
MVINITLPDGVSRLVNVPEDIKNGENSENNICVRAEMMENQFLACGGIPGVNYTFVDCFNAAIALANAQYTKNTTDAILFTCQRLERSIEGLNYGNNEVKQEIKKELKVLNETLLKMYQIF